MNRAWTSDSWSEEPELVASSPIACAFESHVPDFRPSWNASGHASGPPPAAASWPLSLLPGSGPSTPSCSSMNPLKEAQTALPTERVEVRPGRVLAVHHRAGRFIHGRPSDVAIFVHGSCASLVHWRAQIDHLQAAGLAIVAYDFLGCGRSAKPHEQHGQNASALARSSPCGHPSLQMSARFSRAALRAERRALAAWMPKIGCGCLLPRRRFHSL